MTEAQTAKPEKKFLQIKKRDGRTVDFDKFKIASAIFRAARSIGGRDRELAERLAEKVVEQLPAGIPTVEEVQDMVERVIIEEGHAKTAKAYIVYRREREQVRREKARVLEKVEIDQVDKRFDVNALRVLKARYLRKDDSGHLIETPKQLFTRIATHAAIPNLFFDGRVFDKTCGQQLQDETGFDEFSCEENNNKFKIGGYKLNRYHLDAVKRLYKRFNANRQMNVPWKNFVQMLGSGEFDNHEAEVAEFFNLMVSRKFMPNTPAIANFGGPLGMGSACFVLQAGDDLGSIMDTLKHTAIIHQAGGGTGFNFSNLRPEGDIVKSTCGTASGPVSFMQLYDNMTDVIKQGGMRRGANMGILNSNHPDIEKFITAKEGNKALRNFNISVLIMPGFWEHYEKNEPYPLVNPRNGEVVRKVNPRLLFDRIVYQAWESAEPGVIFFDHVNKHNPFYETLGPIVTTNPCVTGDTKVLTENGWIEIEKLAELDDAPALLVDVRSISYNSGQELLQAGLLKVKAKKIWKTGEKETMILTTETKTLEATPDHRILTEKGWLPLEKLKTGEKILVQDGDSDTAQEIILSIKKGSVKAVYDITEPVTHSFIANGIVVHNCGEVLLYPYESCNLGSINVWAFAREDDDGTTFIDWEGLKQATILASRFLDNIIEVNRWPLQEIEDMALNTRKIGLGVMGFADLLYEMKLCYNTEEGRAFGEQLMEFMNYYSKVASIQLAKQRGPMLYYDKSFYPEGRLPFAGADESKQFDWSEIKEQVKENGIRNGFTTVIAPTGSISMIAGCSSGIEPVYALVFEKHVKVGSFFYAEPVFEKVMKKEGLYDEKLMEDIVENRGSVRNIPYITPQLKRVFITAMDITPEDHIRMLAAFQKWTDSSISKTNNFPASATVEDMRESYLLAYKLGCKDVTVFRDTSIKDQVLVAPKKEASEEAGYPQAAPRQTIAVQASGSTLTACPECAGSLKFEEGCTSCSSCAWGMCSG